ncbi:hypothetical protein PR202_gb22378 [Eleusine coracana subsp. coracana]|uniref:PPC domain-containing protein n=1 Tax=Eleusine coracana subsp. coracana TaxID=191504 RepID=A0AAV5FFL8_ELECO|nr:hypothetical protein PR202_gb22378 [Eleusine coracana subsp. coracana]
MTEEESLYQNRNDVPPPVHFMTPPQPQRHPSHHNHGEQQQQLECFSDEVDSRGSAEQLKEPDAGGTPGTMVVVTSDGASIEVAKKRRGRPPGSKNRPKPPIVITREADPTAAMRPHVIEIPCGRDVAQALARFAARRNLGICVLAGTGAVADVTLRHPHGQGLGGGGFVFRGQYEILSISATFLPPAISAVAPQAVLAAAGISISLAGPHGQIIGGAVAGPLYAATNVVVVAAAFTNPTFHRLPAALDDEAAVSVSVSLSAGSGGDQQAADHHHQQQQHTEPTTREHHRNAVQRQEPPHLAPPVSAAPLPVESCGPMSIFACHPQPQDMMWPPPAHGPLPPPPPPPY